MGEMTVAILHPGEMGAAVGACAAGRGARVVWASEGRSAATVQRAAGATLADLVTLDAALEAADVVLSVCPPHGALDVARAVAARDFHGLYVDANAVSPATTRQIGEIIQEHGARFVDGGIVGPPPGSGKGSGTRLYLSGTGSQPVAELFARSALEVVQLDGPPGAASALKACYAGWNKGALALVVDVLALAAREGVDQALAAEWRRSQPDALQRAEGVRTSARKAWRWIAEMEEIAAAFGANGLPAGFWEAAAEVYRRLDRYKDVAEPPPLDEITLALGPR